MKIIRLTRHEAEEAQRIALKKAFGEDCEIKTISESLPMNTREAVARFDELVGDAQVVEAVLPVNLLEAILKFTEFSKGGGVVLRSVMDRKVDDNGSVNFTFNHYEVVKKIEVVTEPL